LIFPVNRQPFASIPHAKMVRAIQGNLASHFHCQAERLYDMKLHCTSFLRRTALLSVAHTFFFMASPGQAQAPYTLERAFTSPPAQTGASLGSAVAIEGNLTVVGAPFDDVPITNSGVVKVFNSSSGALLYVLANPGPGQNDIFGDSVAISGTLVVVGHRRTTREQTMPGARMSMIWLARRRRCRWRR
jgi:hypothetical protein